MCRHDSTISEGNSPEVNQPIKQATNQPINQLKKKHTTDPAITGFCSGRDVVSTMGVALYHAPSGMAASPGDHGMND